MKMHLEMKQMKERLKQDFSREVASLETEIEQLRRSYDNKPGCYSTDEGRGSRTRLRVSEARYVSKKKHLHRLFANFL